MSDAGGLAPRGSEADAERPFDCLWCGKTWRPHDADDLEALARLCPDCLGRADSNPFIRFRLRAALAARARATEVALAAEGTSGTGSDEWYLRRGRHARGHVQDLVWQTDLDAATTWLDKLPIKGRIVEVAAGAGWWSALLASKGELSAFDADLGRLDRVRERLVAHRLRAHLHVRDPWVEPDAAADVLFTALSLSRVPRHRLGAFLALARRWLRPGGLFAFIEAFPIAPGDAEPGDAAPGDAAPGDAEPSAAVHSPAELTAALADAGFTEVAVTTTSRHFVLGRARAGGEPTA